MRSSGFAVAIRVDEIWLATEPLDMRAGPDTALARVENLIRPWAIGRSNWLFAGSLRSGQRAATIMSLIQCAKLNGHEPYAYVKDVLERLPTQKASQLQELLSHNWQHTD